MAGSNTSHLWPTDVRTSDSLAISHDLDQRTLYIGVQKLDPEMFRCLPLSFTFRFSDDFERNESQSTPRRGSTLVKSEEGQVAN